MRNFSRYLVTFFTALIIGCSWWATASGWALPHFETLEPTKNTFCPDWQKDIYGNCPPKTMRLQLGVREFADNRGK